MEILKWSDDYLLGIKQLDNQHKQMVALLNDAFGYFCAEVEIEDRCSALLELVDLTALHVNNEAQWLAVNGYPVSGINLRDQAEFRHKILKLQNYFFKLTENHADRILSYMNRWVTKHVTESALRLSDR